jgi:hypothetical protein
LYFSKKLPKEDNRPMGENSAQSGHPDEEPNLAEAGRRCSRPGSDSTEEDAPFQNRWQPPLETEGEIAASHPA